MPLADLSAIVAQADPVVVRLGLAAVALGLFGPLLLNPWLSLSRDRKLFSSLKATPPPNQCTGPLSRELLPFVKRGFGQSPLSPDHVIEALQSGLTRRAGVLINQTKIFSYLPLLLGLVATALGLRGVLASIASTVVGADDIPRVGGRVFEQTASALLGTVMGVTGAAFATIVQAVLTRAVVGTHSAAVQFVYEVFARGLPEARVKLHFEEEVLDALRSRMAAIAAEFSTGVGPLAQGLALAATECANAATQAQSAFSEVARAVADAKGLTDAARWLAEATERSATTATHLETQSTALAEVVTALHPVTAAVHDSARTLNEASLSINGAIGDLTGVLKHEPESLVNTVAQVATNAGKIEAVTRGVEGQIARLSGETARMSEVIANFGNERVDQLSHVLVAAVTKIQEQLKDALTKLPKEVERDLGLMKLGADDVDQAVKRLRSDIEPLAPLFRELLSTIGGMPITQPARTDVVNTKMLERLTEIDTQLLSISRILDNLDGRFAAVHEILRPKSLWTRLTPKRRR